MSSEILSIIGLGNIDIGYLFLVYTVVLFVIIIVVIVLLAQNNKMRKRYMKFMQGKNVKSLEEKIAELEEQISKCATDFIKLNELMQEKEKTEAELSDKMERWVYLNDLAEKIEAQKRENNNENI